MWRSRQQTPCSRCDYKRLIQEAHRNRFVSGNLTHIFGVLHRNLGHHTDAAVTAFEVRGRRRMVQRLLRVNLARTLLPFLAESGTCTASTGTEGDQGLAFPRLWDL